MSYASELPFQFSEIDSPTEFYEPFPEIIATEGYVFDSLLTYDEDKRTEWKAVQITKDPLKRMISYMPKYINAFLNTAGGKLMFGITDDGEVKGVRMPRNKRDDVRLRVDGLLEKFWPQVEPNLIDVIFTPVTGGPIPELFVVEIHVKKGPAPVYITSKNKPTAYIRRDSSTYVMSLDLMVSRMASTGGSDEWGSALPAPPSGVLGNMAAGPGSSMRKEEFKHLFDFVNTATAPSTVVAIVGAYGVGKKTLALRLAAGLTGKFPQTVMVDLKSNSGAPLTARDAQTYLFCELFPAKNVPSSLSELEGSFASFFRKTRACLVLLNANSAEQVLPLIPNAPVCVIVTTDGDVAGLHSGSEMSFTSLHLGELSRADATAFAVSLHHDLSEDEVSRVIEACGRWPWAIRAAAEMFHNHPGVSRQTIIERLEERDLFLAPESPLAQALAASVAGLSDMAKQVFLAVSLFGGSCTAAAVAVVVDTDEETATLALDELRARAIVKFYPKVARYHMTAIIRDYARRQIVSQYGASETRGTGVGGESAASRSVSPLISKRAEGSVGSPALASRSRTSSASADDFSSSRGRSSLVVVVTPRDGGVEPSPAAQWAERFVRHFEEAVVDASRRFSLKRAEHSACLNAFDADAENIVEAMRLAADMGEEELFYSLVCHGSLFFRVRNLSSSLVPLYRRLLGMLRASAEDDAYADVVVSPPVSAKTEVLAAITNLFSPAYEGGRTSREARVSHELAMGLEASGLRDEAERYYNESLEKRRQALTTVQENAFSQTDVLITEVASMADTLHAQGAMYLNANKFAEAREKLEASVEERKKAIGLFASQEVEGCAWQRVLMASTLVQLSGNCREQGMYKEASDYVNKALGILRRTQSQIELAEALDTRAKLYSALSKYTKAKESLHRALTIKIEVLGEHSLQVAQTRHELAKVYGHEGMYEASEKEYIESMNCRRRVLGNSHFYVANSLRHLAFLYFYHTGEYDRAESLLEQARDILLPSVGSEHTEYAIVINDLGLIYSHQGSYHRALQLFVQSLDIRRRLLPPNHPYIATVLNNMANVHRRLKDDDTAESEFLEALAIRQAAFGETHPECARTIHNLGMMYLYQHRYEECEARLREALALRRECLGDKHVEVALSYSGLGSLAQFKKDFAEAERLMMLALEINTAALPTGHPIVAANKSAYGTLLGMMGRFKEGQTLVVSAVQATTQVNGVDSKKAKAALSALEGFYRMWANSLVEEGSTLAAEKVLVKCLSHLYEHGQEDTKAYRRLQSRQRQLRRQIEAQEEEEQKVLEQLNASTSSEAGGESEELSVAVPLLVGGVCMALLVMRYYK